MSWFIGFMFLLFVFTGLNTFHPTFNDTMIATTQSWIDSIGVRYLIGGSLMMFIVGLAGMGWAARP